MNECRAKIKYVGEFCRLKIHSLALQSEKRTHSKLAVEIYFKKILSAVIFNFRPFMFETARFTDLLSKGLEKPRPRQVDFPVRKVTFCLGKDPGKPFAD